MGETDGELNDLCFVDSIFEGEVDLDTVNLAPAPAPASDFGVIAAPLSYNFFSKLYTHFRQSIMDCVYNYYLPSVSELPAFSSSDVLMVGGRAVKKNDTDTVPFQQFVHEFQALTWFTYRRDFAPIVPSTYTSDTGWGCMLRSAQMMLARTLSVHLLGPDWNPTTADGASLQRYMQILQWFEDKPSAPYSVHKIAQSGINFGKQVGEWFGPSTAAQVLGELVVTHPESSLSIYLSTESMLYLDEISAICTNNHTSHDWLPLLILIPLRLGLDSLNEVYIPSLKKLFTLPQSVGIIGGRPRAAMYFIANQDDSFFFLDPHLVQPFVPMDDPSSIPLQTFHCNLPQKMGIASIDPSMALGFYCKNKQDFDAFWQAAIELSKEESPVFGVAAQAPQYHQNSGHKKEHLSMDGFEDDIVIL
jgi:cysteine protease ATG4